MSQQHPRAITRRESLAVLAAGGGGLVLAACGSSGGAAVAATSAVDRRVSSATAAASCRLTAEQEEGPYYVALDQVRRDLIDGQRGLPFHLEIAVVDVRTCKPLQHAAVDVWHCNAAGRYSDKDDQGTSGQTWLRGVQFTDSHGLATFRSIFPGHYQGRTTHVHVKVHTSARDVSGKLTGGHVAHTGNLFSTDAVNAAVYRLSAYRADTAPIVPLKQDFVYRGQQGSTARMAMSRSGGRLSKGLTGRITLAVDPAATPALVGIHG